MEQSITLPFWFFVLLIITALLLLLDRILLPSARWYLRKRINRVIEDVNSRLDIEIRPFQRTRKQALVEQLIYDDKVVEAANAYAIEHNMPHEVVQAKVQRYAQEIAPSFNAYIYFRFGYWIAKSVARMLYRVRVGFYDDDALKNIASDSSVVFVMNHRSNMDYVLVSFLAAEKTALSYAVGEWARIWPLQSLIKSMGAFFVRRNSRNDLYRRVLERYVHLATRAGVCQAVFLEGGLSRDGKLREPRQGFLDYMLRDYDPERNRDVVLVPIGINYDRVVEDISLVRQLDINSQKRSFSFVLKTSLKFAFKTLLMNRQKRWIRFGYASVNFGKPLSIREFTREHQSNIPEMSKAQRSEFVGSLSKLLMANIEEVIPVLPMPLMCQIILQHQLEWLSELELKSLASIQLDLIKKSGAPVELPVAAYEGIFSGALSMLEGRGFVESKDGLIRAKAESIDLLKYYANSIERWQKSP